MEIQETKKVSFFYLSIWYNGIGGNMEKTFDKSFNEYLEGCKQHDSIKCAIVATDKQCVVLKESESKNCSSHNELAEYIEI